MFMIWNVDAARRVSRKPLRMRDALRYAGILETLFGAHYAVVRL